MRVLHISPIPRRSDVLHLPRKTSRTSLAWCFPRNLSQKGISSLILVLKVATAIFRQPPRLHMAYMVVIKHTMTTNRYRALRRSLSRLSDHPLSSVGPKTPLCINIHLSILQNNIAKRIFIIIIFKVLSYITRLFNRDL